MRRQCYGLVAALSLAVGAVLVPPTLGMASPVRPRAHAARSRLRGLSPGSACGTVRQSLAHWTIVLDPGHGQDSRHNSSPDRSYTGAPGVNGVWEDTNTLAVAQRLESRLVSEGAQVYLTRGTALPGPPGRPSLQVRVALAERVHAHLFLSLHQDSDRSGQAHGVRTFYYHDDARPLAVLVQHHLVTTTGLRDRGVDRGTFYVLYHTTMPAVLVEVGFLSHRREARRISTPAFHQLEADALNRAILAYVRSCPSRVLRVGAESFPVLRDVFCGRAAAHTPQGLGHGWQGCCHRHPFSFRRCVREAFPWSQ